MAPLTLFAPLLSDNGNMSSARAKTAVLLLFLALFIGLDSAKAFGVHFADCFDGLLYANDGHFLSIQVVCGLGFNVVTM